MNRRMNRRNWILTGLLVVTGLLALIAPVSQPSAQAQVTLSQVRFLHAVPGAPSVDIYVDGGRVASGLAFGDVTPHLTLPSGQYQVALRQSGTGAESPALIGWDS